MIKYSRICTMNLKAFNFHKKVHNDIVVVDQNSLQVDEPLSQLPVQKEVS